MVGVFAATKKEQFRNQIERFHHQFAYQDPKNITEQATRDRFTEANKKYE